MYFKAVPTPVTLVAKLTLLKQEMTQPYFQYNQGLYVSLEHSNKGHLCVRASVGDSAKEYREQRYARP